MVSKKLTKKERTKRLDLIEARIKSEREKPEHKENFEAIVKLFGENLDALRHYTTDLEIQLSEVINENKLLCKKLNDEITHARLFTAKGDHPNLTPQVKLNIAENLEKRFGVETSSLNSFQAGVEVSKKTVAAGGGLQRAKKFNELKKYVAEEYSKRKWKSAMQARDALWPKVKEEANKTRVRLTDTTGEETLYRWILLHQKNLLLPENM